MKSNIIIVLALMTLLLGCTTTNEFSINDSFTGSDVGTLQHALEGAGKHMELGQPSESNLGTSQHALTEQPSSGGGQQEMNFDPMNVNTGETDTSPEPVPEIEPLTPPPASSGGSSGQGTMNFDPMNVNTGETDTSPEPVPEPVPLGGGSSGTAPGSGDGTVPVPDLAPLPSPDNPYPGGFPDLPADAEAALKQFYSKMAADGIKNLLNDPNADMTDYLDALEDFYKFDLPDEAKLMDQLYNTISVYLKAHPKICQREMDAYAERAAKVGDAPIMNLILNSPAPKECGGGSFSATYSEKYDGRGSKYEAKFTSTGTLYEPDAKRQQGYYLIEDGVLDWSYSRTEGDGFEGEDCATRTTYTGSGTSDLSYDVKALDGKVYPMSILTVDKETGMYSLSVVHRGFVYPDGTLCFEMTDDCLCSRDTFSEETDRPCPKVVFDVQVTETRIGPDTWPYAGERAPCNPVEPTYREGPDHIGFSDSGKVAPGSKSISGSNSTKLCDDCATTTYSYSFTLPEKRI